MDYENSQTNSKTPKLESVTEAYLAIAVFLTVNNLFYNTLPIILGGLAESKAFDEREIGLLGSIFLTGQMITNITGPFWVGKVNWKWTVGISMALCAAFVTMTAHAGFTMIAVFYLIAGGMTGLTLACMFCQISNMNNPVRAYSISLISQCVIAGFLSIVFQSFVLPEFGFQGLSYLVAFLFLCSIAFVILVPRNLNEQLTAKGHEGRSTSHKLHFKSTFSFWAFVGLVGIVIYYTGQTGVWAFVERIGNSRGFDPDFIGVVTAGSLVLSGLGAWAADLTADKFGNFKPLVFGIFIFVLSMTMLAVTESRYFYFLAIILYSCAWNYMLPYQLLVVSRADKSGTYASMIPAFQAIGSALGPVSMGMLIVDGGGYTATYIIAIAMALVCLLFFWGAHVSGQKFRTV